MSNYLIGNGVAFQPITVHFTPCKWRRPKYLVIHYTASRRSTAGSAEAVRKGWLTAKASADFVVDDTTMLQVNPNPYRNYAWAVGDGRGKYGITNANSVSIEICSTLQQGTSAAMPNHTGWSFSEAALHNATTLARILMQSFGIDKQHVVRHYDASHKACPGIVGWNDAALYDPVTAKPLGTHNNSQTWQQWHDAL